MERNRVTRFLKQCAAVIAESWRNRSAASRSAVRREEGQSYA
jgi:hypothetical protein